MKRQVRNRRGMTAMEVLAATVLTALMLAAVAGILGGLVKQERELRSGCGEGNWKVQLEQQLLWDLRNSRQLVASRDGVWLDGFASRDFVTGRAIGQRALVSYYLIEIRGQRCLVRREQHLDDLTNDAVRHELVCHGINSMKWGEVDVETVSVATNGSNMPPREELATIADRVPVQLYEAGSSRPSLDRIFYVR